MWGDLPRLYGGPPLASATGVAGLLLEGFAVVPGLLAHSASDAMIVLNRSYVGHDLLI